MNLKKEKSENKKIDKKFAEKPKWDLSTLFIVASSEERRRVLEDVARKANQDQRELVEQYHQAHKEPA